MLASNITIWGKKPKESIECGRYDLLLLAEHRQRGQGVHDMKKDLQRMGYRAVVGEAQRTEADSTSGGTMIVFRRQFWVNGFGTKAGEQEEQVASWHFATSRWTLATLRLKGPTIVIGAVYLVTGIGPVGENLQVLRELGEALATIGRPFLVGGDWNMSPEELESTGFLLQCRALALKQAGVSSTCSLGKAGRVLDYFVASQVVMGCWKLLAKRWRLLGGPMQQSPPRSTPALAPSKFCSW